MNAGFETKNLLIKLADSSYKLEKIEQAIIYYNEIDKLFGANKSYEV